MSLVIVHKKLNELNPAKYNPRDITDDAFEGLKESLKKFGMPQPIIFNKKTGNVVGGHQRLKAAGALGWETVPTIEIDISLSEEKALNVTLNNQKISGHFTSGLDALLKEIRIENGDDFFTSLKLGDIEIPPLPEEEQKIENEKADSIPEVAQNELGVQLGDIYQLGEHRLMCGDSTDLQTVEKLMNGEKADMVFTDPPYNMETTGRGAFSKAANALNKQLKGLVDFCPKEFLKVLPKVFQDRMSAFIFCNKDLIPDYLNWCLDNKYNFNVLTWHKKSHVPFTSGSHYPDTEYLLFLNKKAIFNSGLSPEHYRKYWITEKTEKEFGHPTQKPIEIIQVSIEAWSNNLGIVTDFFLGSGSTLIACEKTNRKCYGMELDPHYCSVIIKRWEKFTGKKAVKNG